MLLCCMLLWRILLCCMQLHSMYCAMCMRPWPCACSCACGHVQAAVACCFQTQPVKLAALNATTHLPQAVARQALPELIGGGACGSMGGVRRVVCGAELAWLGEACACMHGAVRAHLCMRACVHARLRGSMHLHHAAMQGRHLHARTCGVVVAGAGLLLSILAGEGPRAAVALGLRGWLASVGGGLI